VNSQKTALIGYDLTMPANAEVDGIKCRIEKLTDGAIRVQYGSPQFNPMQGPGTGGVVTYLVHPCQRNQYERLNALLPSNEQAMPADVHPDQRPWWSLPAGERANFRE
jgi:hypothetical protein